MSKDKRPLLDVLRRELEFVEKGGYRHPSRAPGRPQFMFQDSPTCLNFNASDLPAPCTDCVMMQGVPADSQQRKNLTGLLLKAQDEERRRIARELHDSTGQVLAGLSMLIGQMQKESSTANLAKFEQCREMIGTAATEIRNLSYLLHPPLIEELGLAAAVSEYAAGFAKRSGLDVQVEISSEVGRLSENIEITLFRIIQEALGNVHRHSGSSVAIIRIFCVINDVVLEIQDQGRGLPFSTIQYGVGIKSMQERLRQFGGILRVTSSTSGTIVQAVLPREF
jgi:signal transduction histidine kinase